MKKLGLLICAILYIGLLFAQQEVDGIVFDTDTKQRVARVYIYNTSNQTGTFNNLKGEFRLKAAEGDVLIAATEGYFPDTLTLRGDPTILLFLKKSSIMLREVSIVARKSPDDILRQKQEDYNTAYSKGDPGSLLSVGNSGAGLSIDALYSILSREGKNARYLQEIIERDYQDDIIDYRFTPELVSANTGLKAELLEDFMQQYRPSYYFILNSSDYELAMYIRSSYKKYQRNPAARRLPPLEPEGQSSESPE